VQNGDRVPDHLPAQRGPVGVWVLPTRVIPPQLQCLLRDELLNGRLRDELKRGRAERRQYVVP
jgi:hypothetical protein